ncbi:MAG: ACP phosphodiesterase [Pseudomonadota bacterium]|nr:ACP phosphodiesterase [Pseudomonadota bacterium]
MNFLAHFALSSKNQNLSIGSFLGDFVKGRLSGQYNREVEIGIKLHRAVDAYTDRHLLTRLSRERFGTRFRRIGGIMTDIAYDHLLALSWDSFYDEPLGSFSDRALKDVLAYKSLPRKAENLARIMLRKNSLENYKDEKFLREASLSLDKRLKGRTPIIEAPNKIIAVKKELASDFKFFYPQLMKFAAEWLKKNDQTKET